MSNEPIEAFYAGMGRAEKRRIFKNAKKYPRKFPEFKDMTFAEFNKKLPKFDNKNE